MADVPTDHPSCSKQHAVLQYRCVAYTASSACLPACLCCGALLWFGLSAVGALTPTAVCLGCLACRLTEKEGADGMMRGAVRCVRQPAAEVPAA